MLLPMARNWAWALCMWCSLGGCTDPLPCCDKVPVNEAEYLTYFYEFSETVSNNCSDFSPRDLKLIDQKFQQLSGEWYRRFSAKLSSWERVEILAYCGKYFQCRIDTESEEWLEQLEDLLYGDDPGPSLEELLIHSPLKNWGHE